MKAKRFFLAFFALVCVVAASLSFTSCSSDDDDNEAIYVYTVDTTLGADLGIQMAVVSPFQTAINKACGGNYYTTSNKNNEVIAACDAVYAQLKDQYSFLQGEVKIMLSYGSTDPNSKGDAKCIKSYKFGE